MALNNIQRSTTQSGLSATLMSYTVPTVTNGVLVVLVEGRAGGLNTANAGPNFASAVTFNGTSMTHGVEAPSGGTATWGAGSLFYLVNPTVTTANIAVTIASVATGPSYSVTAFVLDGIDQTTPIDATNQVTNVAASNPSMSATSTADGIAICMVADGNFNEYTATAPATLIGTPTTGDNAAYHAYTGAGTQTVGFTSATTFRPDGGIALFKNAAAGGAGGSVILPPYLFDTMAI